MTTAYIIFSLLFTFTAVKLWMLRVARARETYIRTFNFPRGIFAKIIIKYPHLTQKEMELVSVGLRQFFMAYLKSGKQYVSMPSQIADELWHEFILHTKNYQAFTQRAFGSFFHHVPAAVLSNQSQSNVGLRRCWKYVCVEEHINPIKPLRLPLLFALDAKLNIGNGYHYVADCRGLHPKNGIQSGIIHCGGDFSDTTIDGNTAGLNESEGAAHHGDSHGDHADGGCGGGCGGD